MNKETYENLFENLGALQKPLYKWQCRNFGKDQSPICALRGVGEELGELLHAVLKRDQGIRGTSEEHEEKRKDSIGDFGIFLLNFSSHFNINVGEFKIRELVWDTDDMEGAAVLRSLIHYKEDHTVEENAEDALFVFYGELRKINLKEIDSVNNLFTCIQALIVIMFIYTNQIDEDFYHLTDQTFLKIVNKRDWVKNPVEGVSACGQ